MFYSLGSLFVLFLIDAHIDTLSFSLDIILNSVRTFSPQGMKMKGNELYYIFCYFLLLFPVGSRAIQRHMRCNFL